jgi:hypothetical protein
MPITDPVFLVGAERSGTTLLCLMLDHHPKLAFLRGFEFAVDQLDDTGKYPHNINQYHEYLQHHRMFSAFGLHIDPQLSYKQLVQSFLTQKQQRDKKMLIGATIHHKFHQILHIWPQAKFIHLLRDGRDVALSNIDMGWAGNMYTGVERWIEAELIWQQMQTQLSPAQQLSIKYEDLIINPKQILTVICNFLQLEFDEAMFNYVNTTTYAMPNVSSLQRWRKASPRALQLAECRIATMLEQRHYPLSGYKLINDNLVLYYWMKFDDRWRTLIFRIKRYSVGLWLEAAIARRFGSRQWRNKVQLKINAVDKKYLK